MNGARRTTRSHAAAMAAAPTASEPEPEPQPKKRAVKAKKEAPLPAPSEPEASGEASDSQVPEEQLSAPEELVAEEERLRKSREEANKGALKDILADPGQSSLSAEQFERLDALIRKTQAYAGFLLENMDEDEADFANAEAEAAKDAAEAAEDAAVGGKRGRRGDGKAGDRKRAKPQKTVTQRLLPMLTCELRDYQLKGVRWLVSLYKNGLNGILADQMGLGKTVQTIGMLSYIWSQGTHGPFLIIGPLSVLANWAAEFKRFAPGLPALLYHGNKRERAALRAEHGLGGGRNKKEEMPCIITSYEIAIADIKALQKVKWRFVIVDEGHRLKNCNCKLIRELRTLETANKLLLSGTPLQNNLSELWSLLNFLMPDVFSSASAFERWFDFSDMGSAGDAAAQEQRSLIVGKLHALLKPFLLRRIKADVLSSLPPKQEIVLYADMSAEQQRLNKQLRENTLSEELRKQLAADGGGGMPRGSATRLNNLVMQLRKNCNHPDLITGDVTGSYVFPDSKTLRAECGKLALLDRLLRRLKAGGHKVLIFSQMTRMLDILDTYLEQEGLPSVRLDGSVNWQERQQAVTEFNSRPDLFCFLLSTRAGGLGINLTSADTVIIYDSDWNPHQDMQAMDRAHRIGQSKPVLVLRLATGNSVEGRMLAAANAKLALERLVIRKGAFLAAREPESSKASGFTGEELMRLLSDSIPLGDEPQAGVVSDEMLERLLDRSHMVAGKPPPFEASGRGYECVQAADGPGLLSTVE